MKLDNIVKIVALIAVCITTTTITANAHKGDKENDDKSMISHTVFGKEHYHHGYEKHDHKENGYCKYEENEIKDIASKKGYNDAYHYGRMEPKYDYNDELYLKVYKDEYNKSFNEGKEKLNPEVEKARADGMNDGKENKSTTFNKYDNDRKDQAYKEGYEQGKAEFISELAKEEKQAGISDGENNRSKKILENVDESVIKSYEDGYEEGRKNYLKTIEDEAYNAALGNGKSQSTYKEKDEIESYSNGWDKGLKYKEDVEIAGKNAYLNGESKSVPSKYKSESEIYLAAYDEAKLNEEKEIQAHKENELKIKLIKIASVTIGISVIVIPIIVVLKIRKNKANDDYIED